MVVPLLPLAFSSSFPTVGFEEGPLQKGRAARLQQYIAEALQGKDAPLSKATREGPGFGSPLPTPGAAPATGLLHLLPPADDVSAPAAAPGGRRLWRRASRQPSTNKGEPTSPAAIASPRAPSEPSTAASWSPSGIAGPTPDACGGALARAASQATVPAPLTPPPSSSASSAASEAHGDAAEPRRVGSAGAGGAGPADGRRLASLSPASSFGEGHLERGLSGGSGGGEAAIDVRFVIERLRMPRQTGQVCAWGWEQASQLSHSRRSMPTELFAALWAATEACAGRCHPQDVLGMLEGWYTLMQTCPRHFRLHLPALDSLVVYSIPPAVKRMTECQLAQLASLCCEIALHRCENGALGSSGQGPSARDLMQPIFALAAAEVAWRCCNPMRYVSPQTLSTLDRASAAWRWRVVSHRDSRQLAALKLATAAALEVLQNHTPEPE